MVRFLVCAAALAALAGAGKAAPAPQGSTAQAIARGNYLVRIAGCNDCHTPGYADKAGDVPKALLLTGGGFVWHGPWGTTYPVNLRLFVQGMTLQRWMTTVRTTRARPPMPWYSLRDMTDRDLAAIYFYIRSLGPAGKPAPAYLPPGRMPKAPYMDFVPPPTPVAAAPEGTR